MTSFVKLDDGRYVKAVDAYEDTGERKYKYLDPDYNNTGAENETLPFKYADPSQIVNSMSGDILSFTPQTQYGFLTDPAQKAMLAKYGMLDATGNLKQAPHGGTDYGTATVIGADGKEKQVYGYFGQGQNNVNPFIDLWNDTGFLPNGESTNNYSASNYLDSEGNNDYRFHEVDPTKATYAFVPSISRRQAEAAKGSAFDRIGPVLMAAMLTMGAGAALGAGAGALGATEAGALGATELGTGTGLGFAQGLGDAALTSGAGQAALTGAVPASAAAAESGGALSSLKDLLSAPNLTGNPIVDNALWSAGKGAVNSAISGRDPVSGALTGGVMGGLSSMGSSALNDLGVTGQANSALTGIGRGALGQILASNQNTRQAEPSRSELRSYLANLSPVERQQLAARLRQQA